MRFIINSMDFVLRNKFPNKDSNKLRAIIIKSSRMYWTILVVIYSVISVTLEEIFNISIDF